MWEKCAIDLPVESSAAPESSEAQVQDRELMGRRLSYTVVRRRIFERMVAGKLEEARAFGRNA